MHERPAGRPSASSPTRKGVMRSDIIAGATLPDYQLPDRGRSIRDDLDIAEYTAAGNPPMIPHTLVLAPGPQIHRIYNGYWYWRRQSVANLHRRAWERSRLYPYASSFEDAIAEMGVSGGSSR